MTEKDFTTPQELLSSVARWVQGATDLDLRQLWSLCNGEMDRRLNNAEIKVTEWAKMYRQQEDRDSQ